MSREGEGPSKPKPYSRGPSRAGSPELLDSEAIQKRALVELRFSQKSIDNIMSMKEPERSRYVNTTVVRKVKGGPPAVALLQKVFQPESPPAPLTPKKQRTMLVDPKTPTPQRIVSPATQTAPALPGLALEFSSLSRGITPPPLPPASSYDAPADMPQYTETLPTEEYYPTAPPLDPNVIHTSAVEGNELHPLLDLLPPPSRIFPTLYSVLKTPSPHVINAPSQVVFKS